MTTRKSYVLLLMLGWGATILGCGLWTYGYYASGSVPIISWNTFAPVWIADILPNWQAEVGLLLATLGSIPLYISEIQRYRRPA